MLFFVLFLLCIAGLIALTIVIGTQLAEIDSLNSEITSLNADIKSHNDTIDALIEDYEL